MSGVVKITMKDSSPIRTILVDGSLECLVRLEKWLGTLPEFEIVGKAGSGVEALEQCRVLRPDLVIMDVTLPLMNGYEATARIKENGRCPMVILMSFFPIDESHGQDDHSKADAVLDKGALYKELIPNVMRLFPCPLAILRDRSFDDSMV